MATIKGKSILPRLWTVEQTAQYLGLKPRTIYNGIGRKSKKRFPIKPKRIGKAVRFDIEDIERYLDSL